MPTTKRQAIWFLDSVSALSTPSQTELVFQTADRNYCTDCEYLIGVHSHDEACDYELLVSYVQANF